MGGYAQRTLYLQPPNPQPPKKKKKSCHTLLLKLTFKGHCVQFTIPYPYNIFSFYFLERTRSNLCHPSDLVPRCIRPGSCRVYLGMVASPPFTINMFTTGGTPLLHHVTLFTNNGPRRPAGVLPASTCHEVPCQIIL